METKELFENGMKILQELTTNAHQIQEQVLGDILMRNAGTEYLGGFLNGQADKQLFGRNIPIVTYEDIKSYIDRIANGEPSDILLAEPVTAFFRRCKFCSLFPYFFILFYLRNRDSNLLVGIHDHAFDAALELQEGSQS